MDEQKAREHDGRRSGRRSAIVVTSPVKHVHALISSGSRAAERSPLSSRDVCMIFWSWTCCEGWRRTTARGRWYDQSLQRCVGESWTMTLVYRGWRRGQVWSMTLSGRRQVWGIRVDGVRSGVMVCRSAGRSPWGR